MSGTTKHTKDTKRELPDGWRWVRLEEICEVVSKGTTPTTLGFSYTNTGIPFLRAEDVTGTAVDPLKVAFHISPETDEALSRSRLLPGDFLITIAGTLGRVGYLAEDAPVMNCNQAVAFARPNKEHILVKYLVFACQHNDVISPLLALKVGNALLNLNLQQIRNLAIPLPPLNEQRRIAAILREQMAAVDKARTAAQARLEAVKTLPAAFLRQVFPQPGAPLPAGWRWVRLGDVIEIVSGQVDPTEPHYRDLPHVNGENIESGTGRLLTVRSAAEDQMTSGKYLFDAGVVLYSKLRPYLKKATIADFRGVCSADMYPILPKQDELSSPFLLQILLSEPFTKYAESESQRSRMPKLNRDQLCAYSAPLPPLDEQRSIATILREQMAAVDKARAAAEAELETINTLPAALLRRAFNGEI